jgi:anti-sigma factor RsiW
MTCRELIDFLMEYTDGTLAATVRTEFERHLTVCPSCRAYLDSYIKTVALARESLCHGADEPVPPSVPRGLVQAILNARRQDQNRPPTG